MGVSFKGFVTAKEIELTDLSGKVIAIDAFNTVYQFLSIIRDRFTGEPLKDSKGRITSHLSGLLYRTSKLIETGIRPIFVFDGKPPEFKIGTIKERDKAKKEAKRKWEEAVDRGEPAIRYAQAAARFTEEMVEESKKLLDFMGIPFIQALSEGEAQCAYMCKKSSVDYTGSQDYDSLLFGSPFLVRNLSITGRRKIPRKEKYIEIKPEIIELKKTLDELGVSQKQLIIMGILVGTYYAPGIKGVGPKTALKLVKKHKTLKNILKKVEWRGDVEAEEILDFFLKPPVTNKYKIDWEQPNREKIMEFMVEDHDFSRERIEKVVDKLQQSFTSGRQSSLKGWFK